MWHKKKSGELTKKQRVERAYNAVKPLGVSKTRVIKKLNDLLKIYGDHWMFIEEDGYKVLADALVEDETQEKAPLHLEYRADEPSLRKVCNRSQTNKATSLMCFGGPSVKYSLQNQEEDLLDYDYNQEVPFKKRVTKKRLFDETSPSMYTSQSMLGIEDAHTNFEHVSSSKQVSCKRKKANASLIHQPSWINKPSQQRSGYKDDPLISYNAGSSKDNDFGARADDLTSIGSSSADTKVKDLTQQHKVSSSRMRDFDTKADGLECMESESRHLEGKGYRMVNSCVHMSSPVHEVRRDHPVLFPGDSSTKKRGFNAKKGGLKFMRTQHTEYVDVEFKGDSFLKSNVDVASSSKDEVKLFLVCGSSLPSDFITPNFDEVVKVVEAKFRKWCVTRQPEFSLKKVLDDICECYLSMGAVTANDRRIITPTQKMSSNSNTGKDIVHDKASVKFRFACVSDEDCCSQCTQDCLSAYTRETGNKALLNECLFKESITLLEDSGRDCYFFCTSCSFGKLKNNHSCSCKGHLRRQFIQECWSKCGCSLNCGNCVAQRDITTNLQVFWTPELKGWGLRTTESLPRGAFICENAGERVTASELYERNTRNPNNQKNMHSKILDAAWGLDNVSRDKEALVLDATKCDNIARFLGHRCFDANLIEIPVQVETPHGRHYQLAFFTKREIAAMEELTWDYGVDFKDDRNGEEAFKCLCGSLLCRDSSD